jgi:hypothetical protein
MAYMVRLGLWGDGTYFRDFGDFLGSVLSLLFLFFKIVTMTGHLFPSHFILTSATGKHFDTCL